MMHLLISTIWFGSFTLFCMTMAAGAIPQAIICGIIAVISAIILRSMTPVIAEHVHYRTEYHHHHEAPIHFHHDHSK